MMYAKEKEEELPKDGDGAWKMMPKVWCFGIQFELGRSKSIRSSLRTKDFVTCFLPQVQAEIHTLNLP
jgi:hypothetical protein